MSLADTTTPLSTQSSTESRLSALEAMYRQAVAEIADMHARDALKTQFLANISHDLRTPLTAVITHAEILRDGMLGSLNERQLESIRGIIDGTAPRIPQEPAAGPQYFRMHPRLLRLVERKLREGRYTPSPSPEPSHA